MLRLKKVRLDEFKTAEQIRDYILNYRTDSEEDFVGGRISPCFSLSWKRDHWVVKENYKKISTIEPKMLPKGFDLRAKPFLEDSLAILRKGGLKGLDRYMRALKRRTEEIE